jgi:hypothetical protein
MTTNHIFDFANRADLHGETQLEKLDLRTQALITPACAIGERSRFLQGQKLIFTACDGVILSFPSPIEKNGGDRKIAT